MKKYILILCIFFAATSIAQPIVNTVYADTFKITKRDGSPAEFILKNATRNISGFLKNVGGGRTEFVTIPTSDTTSLSARIDLRVKYSDTATMLSPYLRKVDTASLSNRIDSKLSITTAASTYQTVLNRPVTATANFPSGYFLRATGSTTADSSGIFQSGSNFGIGTTTPANVWTIERNVSGNLYNTIRNNNTTNSSARFVATNNNGNDFSMGMFSSTHSGTQYGYNVANSAVFGANLASGARVLFGTVSNNDVVFGSNNVARIIIAAGGAINITNLSAGGTVYSNAGTLTNVNPSDERLKNSIEDLGYGLNEILKLKPKTFYYNSDSTKSSLKYGFIAQEVEKVMPTVVRKLEPDNSDSKLGLESDGIYVAMVKAIQQQQAIINDLKRRIETLENK